MIPFEKRKVLRDHVLLSGVESHMVLFRCNFAISFGRFISFRHWSFSSMHDMFLAYKGLKLQHTRLSICNMCMSVAPDFVLSLH